MATPDDIYTLIATRKIHVDLTDTPLAEPERVHIFADSDTAQACRLILSTAGEKPLATPVSFNLWPGGTFMWDGKRWQILNVGETEITLLTEGDVMVPLPCHQLDTLITQGHITGIQADNEAGLSAEARDILSRASLVAHPELYAEKGIPQRLVLLEQEVYGIGWGYGDYVSDRIGEIKAHFGDL